MSYIGTKEVAVTILNAASLSAAVELHGADILRINMPAAWTAADLTFQLSDDGGGNWYGNVYWDWGPEMVIDADVDMSIELSPFVGLHNIDRIKVRSGTAGVPVAQGDDRVITLIVGAKD